MEGSPWLQIPAEDYEGHMAAIGQSAVLRDLFSLVCAERKPIRLVVLGCTTGSDLQQVDPAFTEVVVGVDINPAYLEVARKRLSSFGARLHFSNSRCPHKILCDPIISSVRQPVGCLYPAFETLF